MAKLRMAHASRLGQQHRRWLETSGATVEGAENAAVEISPLVTFAGEGLEEYNGKLIKTPVTIGQCTMQNGH